MYTLLTLAPNSARSLPRSTRENNATVLWQPRSVDMRLFLSPRPSCLPRLCILLGHCLCHSRPPNVHKLHGPAQCPLTSCSLLHATMTRTWTSTCSIYGSTFPPFPLSCAPVCTLCHAWSRIPLTPQCPSLWRSTRPWSRISNCCALPSRKYDDRQLQLLSSVPTRSRSPEMAAANVDKPCPTLQQVNPPRIPRTPTTARIHRVVVAVLRSRQFPNTTRTTT